MLGYSMADHMRTELVLDALGMAIAARGGVVAGVIAHADRGSQYTSNDYLDFCQAHQLRPSVGRVATCFDNNRCVRTSPVRAWATIRFVNCLSSAREVL